MGAHGHHSTGNCVKQPAFKIQQSHVQYDAYTFVALPYSMLVYAAHRVSVGPAGQSGMEDNTDADESSDDDSNELPFLARESMALPRPSHDQRGAKYGEDAPGRHSKEVMEIPEAVEAVTGVNASYLPVRPCH